MKQISVLSIVLTLLCSSCSKAPWIIVDPSGGGYLIEMPEEPGGRENRSKMPNGDEMYGWNYILPDIRGFTYVTGYTVWPDEMVQNRPKDFFLNSLSQLIDPISKESKIELDGVEGKEIIGESPMGKIRVRIFMKENTTYHASVTYSPEAKKYVDYKRYFKSFKFK